VVDHSDSEMAMAEMHKDLTLTRNLIREFLDEINTRSDRCMRELF
jgi:hypothetical protein